MANPYARQTANRKLVYLGAVLALFTAALWHRQVNIKPLGEDLQLRETTRGEVDLTSSALRLTLSGSRGMAVTILWMQANLLQDRGEWHELELVVDSITKLQPYFIEPWVWQSWNLAYNVGRELDRPFDKYYYVSRGMHMLAEGERRNQGTEKFPGNPEMRIQIARMYEDKIGLSDERNAMRSLFELSCIDPRQRDPRRFWNSKAPDDKALNPKTFEDFCREQPRLVRRLADKLNYRTPKEVGEYLWKNRDVPMRFEDYDWRDVPDFSIQAGTKVKRDPFQHFPLFPARLGKQDPMPVEVFTKWLRGDPLPDGNDVFAVSRSWMYYAQDPFPPNTGDPSDAKLPAKEPWKYRLAKRPPLYICRGFPATSQMHIADQLQAEGWFLREGWQVPESFEFTAPIVFHFVIGRAKTTDGADIAGPLAISKGSKLTPQTNLKKAKQDGGKEGLARGGERHRDTEYGQAKAKEKDPPARDHTLIGVREDYLDSEKAWEKAYEVLRNYGIQTGLYFPPADRAFLEAQAHAYRVRYNMPAYQKGSPPPEAPGLMASYESHVRLYNAESHASVTSYETRLERAEAERDPYTVKARRMLFLVKAAEQANEKKLYLRLNQQFWPMWLDVLFKHPRFADNEVFMQDMVMDQHRFIRAEQRARRETVENLCIGMAQIAMMPHLPLGDPNFKLKVRVDDEGTMEEQPLLDERARFKIVPSGNVHGPLEMARVMNVHTEAVPPLRAALAVWPQTGAAPVYFAPLAHQNWIFARQELRDAPLADGVWRHLISDAIMNSARHRLGLSVAK